MVGKGILYDLINTLSKHGCDVSISEVEDFMETLAGFSRIDYNTLKDVAYSTMGKTAVCRAAIDAFFRTHKISSEMKRLENTEIRFSSEKPKGNQSKKVIASKYRKSGSQQKKQHSGAYGSGMETHKEHSPSVNQRTQTNTGKEQNRQKGQSGKPSTDKTQGHGLKQDLSSSRANNQGPGSKISGNVGATSYSCDLEYSAHGMNLYRCELRTQGFHKEILLTVPSGDESRVADLMRGLAEVVEQYRHIAEASTLTRKYNTQSFLSQELDKLREIYMKKGRAAFEREAEQWLSTEKGMLKNELAEYIESLHNVTNIDSFWGAARLLKYFGPDEVAGIVAKSIEEKLRKIPGKKVWLTVPYKARRINLRKTVERAMRTGAPADIFYKKRRKKKNDFIVIADVSGSMQEEYPVALGISQAASSVLGRSGRVLYFVDRLYSTPNKTGWTDFAGLLELPKYVQDRDTPIILITDLRQSSGAHPAAVIDRLKKMGYRHIYVLNPEPEDEWGTGDSRVWDVEELVPVYRADTIDDIARAIEDIAYRELAEREG